MGCDALDNLLGKYLIQNQKLDITPNMIQFVKLLQVPCADLESCIEEELRDNPMLEKEANDDAVKKILTASEDSYAQYYSRKESGYGNADNTDRVLPQIKKKTTLKEYLHQQLGILKNIDPLVRRITAFLIESLDEDGYLKENINSLTMLLNVERNQIRKSLRALQNMHPAGVGARNLKECLLIQLMRKRLLNDENKNIILFHFEQLVKKNFTDISKKTGIKIGDIQKIFEMVQDLNPRPGVQFINGYWEPVIIPDIIVTETDGVYSIQYNDESVPNIRINSYYKKLLRDPLSSHETKEYIKSSIIRAANFIKAIEQRKRTIQNIAEFIVEYQKEFIKKGQAKLKPLTMKDVADALEISESTVSRAVSGKYIQIPRGVFEFKLFFSAKIGDGCSNDYSAAAVKDMIKNIIASEDKSKPLSDEKVRKILLSKGVPVARRTVAKYREELGILSTILRKEKYV